MTALFIIIFIDQWEKTKDHVPAFTGFIAAVICLLVFGERNFMLPALAASSGILVLKREYRQTETAPKEKQDG